MVSHISQPLPGGFRMLIGNVIASSPKLNQSIGLEPIDLESKSQRVLQMQLLWTEKMANPYGGTLYAQK